MKRTVETYKEHISSLTPSYVRQFDFAYKNFGDVESFIDSNPSENDVFDTIQAWINKSKNNPATIKNYFSHIRQYLHYRGIKMHDIDIKQNLKFPAKYEEEFHPLSIDEIKKILESCNYQKHTLFLAQCSSGMRIGELSQLRKKHIVTGMARLMVKIPASITKKKRGRTTFFSAEVTKRLVPVLNRINDNDFVFGDNTKVANILYLERLLRKLGMDQKYDTSNRFKISTHSFRSFFITRISRHDPNLAKLFSGQKGYLLQYDRLTDEEKIQYYLKFESDLMIYDQSKNEEKISELEYANRRLSDQVEQITGLKSRVRNLENEIFLRRKIT